MIVCAGGNEIIQGATPVGIGMIDPVITLTQMVSVNKPPFLLFVGTAGSYGNLDLLSIHESRVASHIEASFLYQQSYTPLDNVVSSTQNVSRETIVNSSNYITTDKSVSQKMVDLGISLENMEFFSIMRVAQFFQIPCGGVFCVTNYCDPQAHELFLSHHQRAKDNLVEYLHAKGY